MRIQIIPSNRQKFLRDFYGCYLWKIYDVVKVHSYRSHGNCKVYREWKEYEINVIHTYPHNHYLKPTTIRLLECEFRFINLTSN